MIEVFLLKNPKKYNFSGVLRYFIGMSAVLCMCSITHAGPLAVHAAKPVESNTSSTDATEENTTGDNTNTVGADAGGSDSTDVQNTHTQQVVDKANTTQHDQKDNKGVNLPPPPSDDEVVNISSDRSDLPSVTMSTKTDNWRNAIISAGIDLTPEEIKKFHTLWIQSMKAQSASWDIKNKTTAQYTVTLSPDEVLPDTPMAPNIVSSLVFQDQTGAPWPITSAILGNSAFFSLVIPATGSGNMAMITPLRLGIKTNLIITLKNIDTPVIINISSNDKVAQVRTTLTIQQSGPRAKIMNFVTEPRKIAGSEELVHVLTGVLPINGAIHLYTDWPDTEIWRKGGTLYIRSAYQLVSPAWTSEAHSQGFNAWILPWSSELVFSLDGQERILHINDELGDAHG